MTDIHSILQDYRPKRKNAPVDPRVHNNPEVPTVSEIPDIFFDEIVVKYKLSRIDILVIMYLYRRVWCRPNLYREFGISQILSHQEMCRHLSLSIEELHNTLRRLEDLAMVATVRSGQYFVRKYFSRENDERYGQTYDDFEI